MRLSTCAFIIGMAILGGAEVQAATCTVPNNISNGQVADAAPVMENFNAVAQCSDAVASATVTTSGTPVIGSIAAFSGPKIVTGANLSGDVTTSGGTITQLSNTGVVPGAYAAANIVVDAKGRVLSASNGSAGGGGGGWALIYSNNAITNPTSNIVVNVSNYNDVMVVGRNVTSATSGYRGVFVSVDGGVTYFNSSGNYVVIAATGAESSTFVSLNHNSATTAARSFGGIIYGLRIPMGPKFMQNLTNDPNRYFVASANPITHIKISVASVAGGADINMTSGQVYVYGR